MLEYFIIFVLVGLIVSYVTKNESTTIIVIIIIAIVWGIVTAPIWGLVSLGEMTLGYFIYSKMVNKV